MATTPLQSAGLRFVRKFGVAFLWALVFGVVFGAAVYFRVDRRELGGELRWHDHVRLWIERLEWQSFDWRVRELAVGAKRSDDVVLVSVDEETVANATEAERPELAMRPWLRDVSGAVVEQALAEGAELVLFDVPLADVSSRYCAPCRGEARASSDDERLAARLGTKADRVFLGWDWSSDRLRVGDRPLMPFVVRVAETDGPEAFLRQVEGVIAARTPVYALLEDGSPVTAGEPSGKVTIWAGAQSEAEAQQLASRFGVKGPPIVRPRTAVDDEAEIDRAFLVLTRSRVVVEGLDPKQLLLARGISPPVAEVLKAGASVGFVTQVADPDGRVRAVPLLVAAKDRQGREVVVASAPLRLVMRRAGVKTLRYEDGFLHVGELRVPMDPSGHMLLRWDAPSPGRGGQGTTKRSLPAWRLALNRQDDEAGAGVRHHDNELVGRVVVFQDERAGGAPVQTAIGAVSHGALMAQVTASMLAGVGLVRAAPKTDALLTVIYAFLGALLAVAWSSLVRRPGWLLWVATILAASVLHGLVARQLFLEQQRWVVMVAPILALAFTFLAALGYARSLEHGLRDFMQRALGGAVRADLFRRVERDLALMRPERRELTVFFSDIEGFTALAQSVEPRALVTLLREYLAKMTDIVLADGGHVDKYLGDGLMAFWGAPVQLEDQVDTACQAALDMQAAFAERKAQWEAKAGAPLVLRAGLDVGPTVVGEMGTLHRVNYTVMGEPVATAARLEGMAKRYGVKVLVSEAVLKGATQVFVFRPVDRVRLGRYASTINLFELVGRRDQLSAEDLERCERFAAAVSLYNQRLFEQAKAAFEALGDEALAQRYARRCAAFMVSPPKADWDGTADW